MVNIAKKPCRAFLTFVSFSKSYAFLKDELGTILDTSGARYVTKEPNANQWQWTMGFLIDTT